MSTVAVPRSADRQRTLDAQGNALLQQLVAATPAQIDAYLTANVTNIVQARAVLKALALGLRHVYLQRNTP